MKLGISQQRFGSRASVNIELIKPNLALYIGGMGARNKNFYTDYACRLGFADAAHKIQDLYLAGNKQEAIAAVPDELINAVHLVDWKASNQRGEVDLMIVGAMQTEALDLPAEEML